MKPITPSTHGYLDYVTVAVFLLAPKLLGFEGLPALLSWTLAGVHLVLTLATDFPLGWRPWYARRRTAYAGSCSERRLSQKGNFRDTPWLRRDGQEMIDDRENDEERNTDAEAPADQLFFYGQQRLGLNFA